MATHSSVLAWRIPGAGKSSMGSQRVGHDWSDLAAAAAVYKSVFLSYSPVPALSLQDTPLVLALIKKGCCRRGQDLGVSPPSRRGALLSFRHVLCCPDSWKLKLIGKCSWCYAGFFSWKKYQVNLKIQNEINATLSFLGRFWTWAAFLI